MKKLIIMLLGAAATVLPAAEDALILFDFENPREARLLWIKKNN